MKKLLTILIAAVCFYPTFSQVGIGTLSPDSSAVLDLQASDKGLLIPRLTQTQRNAISTPVEGLMIYQTDNTAGFYYHNGSSWQSVGSGADDMGDHTATQNISLGSNYLSGDGDNEGVYVGSTGKVGIGTASPQEELHINGSVRITDGSEGSNRVLVSDDNGTASWVAFDSTNVSPVIYAQLSDSTVQQPTTTDPWPIVFSTNDEIYGIQHVEGDTELVVLTSGVYNIMSQPQVNRNNSSGNAQFHCWFQIDEGSGWVDIENSNILLDMRSTAGDDVVVINLTTALNAGDKIRVMMSTSDVSKQVNLKPILNISDEPNIPSIIFTMFKL